MTSSKDENPFSIKYRTNLYHILEIFPEASEEEVKKAYRRLALQHHPDRQHGNEALFRTVNYAYEVLSDPPRRRTYDRHGSAGLQLYEMVQNEKGVDFLLNKGRLGMLMGAMGGWLALLLITPVMIAIKVAGLIQQSWMVCLMPLWICDAIFLIFLLTILPETYRNLQRGEVGQDGMPRNEAKMVLLLLFITFSLVLGQQLLIVTRLDGIIKWSSWLVLGPSWLVILASLTSRLGSISWNNNCRTIILVGQTCLFPWCCFLFVWLLNWRMQMAASISWTGVLIPIYLYLIGTLVSSILPGLSLTRSILYLIMLSLTLLQVLLINLRLEGVLAKWHMTFLPLYLVTTLAQIANLLFWILSYWGTRQSILASTTISNPVHEAHSPATILYHPGYVWANPQLRIEAPQLPL